MFYASVEINRKRHTVDMYTQSLFVLTYWLEKPDEMGRVSTCTRRKDKSDICVWNRGKDGRVFQVIEKVSRCMVGSDFDFMNARVAHGSEEQAETKRLTFEHRGVPLERSVQISTKPLQTGFLYPMMKHLYPVGHVFFPGWPCTNLGA